MSADKGEHIYGEGFKLMWYRCIDTSGPQTPGQPKPGCGHAERIWNSRNGVTPFGLSCPSCGGSLLHVSWGLDEYAPNHKLRRHQRYFRDGTVAEALAIMDKRFERHPPPGHVARSIIAQIKTGTCEEFRQGWPTICVHEGKE